jgi:hypothetical protein
MTEPTRDNAGGDLPGVVVLSVTALILAVISAVVVLSLSGRDVTPLITTTGAILIPTITTLLAVRNSRQIGIVDHKVDKKIDNLVLDKANLEHQVSTLGETPVTATVSFDPVSTGPIPAQAPPPPVIHENPANPIRNPITSPISAAEIIARNRGVNNG